MRKNTIWNTIGITFNAFNSLFFLIIINRINGLEDGGVFSYAFSLACLLYVIGVYATRTYQVSDVNRVLNDGEYLLHKLITCALMMLVCFIFIFIKNYTFEKNMIIVFLTLYKCLEAFSDTLYGYLQKNEELYLVGISLFLKSLISIFVFLIIDYITKNLFFACISLIVINLIIIIFFDFLKVKKIVKLKDIKLKRSLKLFRLGFAVFAFSFLSIYIVNVPKYVIDGILSDSYQAIFNIIVMPATVISLCGQYIMGPSLTGLVSDYNNKNYEEFKNKILKFIKILLLLWIVVEIGAYILGIPILSIVYNINLNAYKMDLLVIILGGVLYAVTNILSTGLITMRKNNYQLLIYSISAIIGLLLSKVLIANFGIHGATFAYFGTMLCHVIMYIIYFNYEYKKIKECNYGKKSINNITSI